MTEKLNYKKTLIACYLGFVTQAISANFAPLLFLTFKSSYGISLKDSNDSACVLFDTITR